MKVKEESENVGLKVNIQKTKIMASGPITSWQRDGETMETVRDFIFKGSKITAYYDYWMLGAGALGRPRGIVWGGRREEGSGWGTHVYLWQIHFDIWQNQYNIVKLNKIKLEK